MRSNSKTQKQTNTHTKQPQQNKTHQQAKLNTPKTTKYQKSKHIANTNKHTHQTKQQTSQAHNTPQDMDKTRHITQRLPQHNTQTHTIYHA